MSYKENNKGMGNSSSVSVKHEPRETFIAPLTRSDSLNNNFEANLSRNAKVKPEPSDAARVFLERGLPVPSYVQQDSASGALAPQSVPARNSTVLKKDEDVVMDDATNLLAPPVTDHLIFTVYNSADEIEYAPEDALQEGLCMVKSIKSSLKHLQLGSKLRQDVWLRELESLTSQGSPTTLIAVCGATGAGKSSILNAILDDNIVPTSGMRACTAVVTELAYHNKPTIDADVSFLSETEWREELAILLKDLVDEDGNVKRSTDLKSDAGIAWQKVHAVYPTIKQERLVTMTADQIIASDHNIAKILGVVKNISAKDSKAFAREIGKYIDSKDQKRGDKKDKGKKKSKEKSLMDKVREASGNSRTKANTKADADAPALWPLIRQVNVRCNSAALSTGAILVDLPGVADANAARNSIAKDYMKKCDCIWILAPITRAVDDKTARDLLGDAFKMQLMNGNYDDHAITFIASKCDDVSCSEVIRALRLEDDPELETIQEQLDQYEVEQSQWKKMKKSSETQAKAIKKEVEGLRKYKAHLEDLQAGKTIAPRLMAKMKATKMTLSSSKKRKNASAGKKGATKRRRSSVADDDDNSDSAIDSDLDSDSDNSLTDSEDERDSDEDSDEAESSSDVENSDDEDDEDEEDEVAEESLEDQIKETEDGIKSAGKRALEARNQKRDATDALATLKKNIGKAQRAKNAFCSLKRSEYSRDVLKEDFRVGLKDLDDAAAEERDPDNFDPNQNIRDYDDIDLPVFTCSSRDYVRLKRQVKGDGEPTCFSNAEDTGIPELQQWCHQLTVSSRERAARNFLAHLKTFTTSVQSYVRGIGDVTVVDRNALREKWESDNLDKGYDDDDDSEDDRYGPWANSSDDDPFAAILGGLGGSLGAELYSVHKAKPTPKVDAYGQPVGITPRLALEFSKLVDKCVKDLQDNFKEGLEDKCQVGAANAAAAAVATSDEFVASMHWATYRATLRRHGSWRRDLNVELVNPFTRNIAHSWSQVFESDLFGPFEAASIASINKLLEEFEESAAMGLKDRTKMQGKQCLEEAHVALKKTMDLVKETMTNEQKEVSRCMAPHVQMQLIEGYDRAMEERGPGSVARQRVATSAQLCETYKRPNLMILSTQAYFRGFIDESKDEIFDDGADVLMDRLTKAAEAVGHTLDTALEQLAQKIEVNLSILWEGTDDDPTQARARQDIITIVTAVLEQIEFWTNAKQSRHLLNDANAMET
ncbi:hypothetical protein FPV67DRAFT_1664591 [Lyophyllum atratum]|nr:hypothetical protein FPV67DRAFT_1664591 [Lyophyllum atratum]